ncbi:Uncharacterised protein [uncultured archaeon]|nr:Uncharacterised protein [uncultured archaeon]
MEHYLLMKHSHGSFTQWIATRRVLLIGDIDVDYYALAYIQEYLSRATMFQLNIPVLTLTAVFILIAFRQVGGTRLHIWQIMLLGALTVLLT